MRTTTRIVPRCLAGLVAAFLPALCQAAESVERSGLNIPGHWQALLALAVFIVAYVLVMLEEYTDLRKSKPVVLAAGLIWILIAGYVAANHIDAPVQAALQDAMGEFAQLFLFLLVAMTYVNAMADRNVFDSLRAWLAHRGFSYRQLFWITGWLAFFISPFIDNLTTSLVLSAVALAVGRGNSRFIALACINIVVGANAGGAFSPFGDITTLMVWQTNALSFTQFFLLFVPAVVNFVVPAAFMHFAVPKGAPDPDAESGAIKRGGWATIALFALTIATAVGVHNWLDLPPYVGMMIGLTYLQILMFYLLKTALHKERRLVSYREANQVPPPHLARHEQYGERSHNFNIFSHIAAAEWDTLLFFYGVILAVGGLGFLGYLAISAHVMYGQWGATAANVVVGLLSSVVDNIPIMAAVIHMHPAMSEGQWLLVTLTAGVGGSILSIGSAAGVALMGQARGHYTFVSHLKWTPVIGLGYAASIVIHFLVNGSTF
ncbi:MAG: sodium:proton antiporter NhaD [Arenicellales bacterium]